jgi:hypothetical protein
MNKKYLDSLVSKYKKKYHINDPYEHIYIKDIFSDEFLGELEYKNRAGTGSQTWEKKK